MSQLFGSGIPFDVRVYMLEFVRLEEQRTFARAGRECQELSDAATHLTRNVEIGFYTREHGDAITRLVERGQFPKLRSVKIICLESKAVRSLMEHCPRLKHITLVGVVCLPLCVLLLLCSFHHVCVCV